MNDGTLDDLGFGISLPTLLIHRIRLGLIQLWIAAQHVEAMSLRSCQQPRPRMFRCRSPPEAFDSSEEDLLCRVGRILGFAQQEMADEIHRGGVPPINVREPPLLFVAEAAMQLVPRVPKLNRC
jgi:hypothetical protein